MGGHSAWRRRVARGELGIQSGGAIARHRPRWGRKGEDLKLNRKGNIAGGNPKKMKKKRKNMEEDQQHHEQRESEATLRPKNADESLLKILLSGSASII